MSKVKIALSILSAIGLSSCSVYMASQTKGISPEKIEQCNTRTCLLNSGAEVISQKTNKNNVRSEEIFQVQKPSGSTARAVMHGALDVATLGVWEVAGTPMEGVMNKPDKYGIKVLYKNNGEDIKAIQLASR